MCIESGLPVRGGGIGPIASRGGRKRSGVPDLGRLRPGRGRLRYAGGGRRRRHRRGRGHVGGLRLWVPLLRLLLGLLLLLLLGLVLRLLWVRLLVPRRPGVLRCTEATGGRLVGGLLRHQHSLEVRACGPAGISPANPDGATRWQIPLCNEIRTGIFCITRRVTLMHGCTTSNSLARFSCSLPVFSPIFRSMQGRCPLIRISGATSRTASRLRRPGGSQGIRMCRREVPAPHRAMPWCGRK
jgi:hypothetical protein